MAFNPKSINLSYKKQRTPLTQETTLTLEYPLASGGVSVTSVPNWLKVTLVSGSDGVYVYRLQPVATYADVLSVGTYSQIVEFKYKFSFFAGTGNATEKLTVSLTVSDTVLLSVNPSFISQTYTIGAAAPGKKFLSITSENNWTVIKDQSWMTINKTSGTGNTSLEVGFDPSGLSAGVYTGQILVDDGYDKKTVAVTLNVLGENTSDDYLIVTPDSFEWVEEYQEPSTKTKKIVVDSSEDFTITSNVSWITFSSNSWPAGQKSIQAVATDTDLLTYGVYQGLITIASSYSTKTVQVLLTINKVVVSGVDSNGLYFADDRNKLSFANTVDNSVLVLSYTADNGIQQFLYPKSIPFYRGVAESILGQEVKNIIAPNYELDNLNTRCFVPVKPVTMNIGVYDKIINASQQTLRKTLTNVQVLTGATPKTSNWLSYIPSEIYTVKDAIVVFTFMADTAPTEINITGADETDYNVTGLSGGIYSCLVNLSELSLSVGDSINISCGGYSVKVNIDPVEPEHTKLVWLNEWNCPEIFTCRGDLTISNESTQTLASYAEEGKERSTVLDVTLPTTYEVNTGYLYSREEVDWLHSILRAKKIWLQINGEFVEVVRTFDAMDYYETRNILDAYELTFEKAIV